MFNKPTSDFNSVEGKGRSSTVDLLIKLACFLNKQIMFAISKTADLNYLRNTN
jgi:hypothetical protein